MNDLRRSSPSAARNKQPLLDVLQRVLPARGYLLEIASGSGEHAAHLAAHLPGWTWQPTELDRDAFDSIDAWRTFAGVANLLPPKWLDVTAGEWTGLPPIDAIFCANMVHIAPWAACEGLMRGAGRYLAPRGLLIAYGPYLLGDDSNAPSNLAFDADLRARNPEWGVRPIAEVVEAAERAGLALNERVPMPSNNLTLVFQRKKTD